MTLHSTTRLWLGTVATLIVALFAGMIYVQPAHAATEAQDARGSSLSDLIVLDALFGGSGDLFGDGDSNFSDLIILDSLFAGDTFGNNDATNNNRNSLEDLIVLDALFGGGDNMFSDDNNDLRDLIILDSLFMNGGSGNDDASGNLFGNSNWSDLIIMNTLFD